LSADRAQLDGLVVALHRISQCVGSAAAGELLSTLEQPVSAASGHGQQNGKPHGMPNVRTQVDPAGKTELLAQPPIAHASANPAKLSISPRERTDNAEANLLLVDEAMLEQMPSEKVIPASDWRSFPTQCASMCLRQQRGSCPS
jgi:hypothetical protein